MAAAVAAGLAFTAHAASSDDPHITGMNADSFTVGSYITIYGDNFGEAMGPSYVMYGDRPVPIVSWSNRVITGVLPAHLFGTPLPNGVPAQLVVHIQPGDHQSNPMPLQIAGVTSTGGSTGNGTTPGTGGTTQPAVSRNQILNDALLVERLAAQFFIQNANKAYLTAGAVTNPGTGTGQPTTPTTGVGPATSSSGSSLSAQMTGAAETPPVDTTATATATFNFNQDQTQLSYEVHATGLSGPATAMHLHRAAPGVAGPIVYPLNTPDADGNASGTVAINAEDVDPIKNGDFYINIHTADHPGGEIRGQVQVASQTTPPTTTPGGSTTNLDSLRGIVTELQNDHNAHVALLEQTLGADAQATPTFQNLDAPTLQQFVTMAQTFEDFAVSAHQGLIVSAYANVTTVGDPNVPQILAGIDLNDARHAGALRGYRKLASTEEGGDPNLSLDENGGAVIQPLTRDQLLAFVQPYLPASGTPPSTGTTPTTGTTPSTGTTPGTGTSPGTGSNTGTAGGTGSNGASSPTY
jgi:hypothetical protein